MYENRPQKKKNNKKNKNKNSCTKEDHLAINCIRTRVDHLAINCTIHIRTRVDHLILIEQVLSKSSDWEGPSRPLPFLFNKKSNYIQKVNYFIVLFFLF